VIGGQVDVANVVRIGTQDGTDALVTLREDAQLNASQIFIGGTQEATAERTAKLFVISGSRLDVNGQATVGTNGEWTAESLSVGKTGEGTLNVVNGGSVKVTQTPLVVGDTQPGHLIVHGVSSGLPFASSVEANGVAVGSNEPGTVTVGNGGFLKSTDDMSIGFLGAVGEVTVEGIFEGLVASELEVQDHLTVGALSEGKLNVRDGGVVRSKTMNIGHFLDQAQAQGEVVVSGRGEETASELRTEEDVTIGSGTFRVEEGGEVRIGRGIGHGFLAIGDRGTGTVTITGEGDDQPSTIVAFNGFEVGLRNGVGALAWIPIRPIQLKICPVGRFSAGRPLAPRRRLVESWTP